LFLAVQLDACGFISNQRRLRYFLRYSKAIERLHGPFNKQATTDRHARFEKSSKTAMMFLLEKKVPELLGVVLDRLYVLRNLLMRGATTWKSKVNRQQAKDGCSIMMTLMQLMQLMQLMIETMLGAKDEELGEVFYPVIQ
jgi:hypothetical protein